MVSHAMGQLRELCDCAMLLEAGRLWWVRRSRRGHRTARGADAGNERLRRSRQPSSSASEGTPCSVRLLPKPKSSTTAPACTRPKLASNRPPPIPARKPRRPGPAVALGAAELLHQIRAAEKTKVSPCVPPRSVSSPAPPASVSRPAAAVQVIRPVPPRSRSGPSRPNSRFGPASPDRRSAKLLPARSSTKRKTSPAASPVLFCGNCRVDGQPLQAFGILRPVAARPAVSVSRPSPPSSTSSPTPPSSRSSPRRPNSQSTFGPPRSRLSPVVPRRLSAPCPPISPSIETCVSPAARLVFRPGTSRSMRCPPSAAA